MPTDLHVLLASANAYFDHTFGSAIPRPTTYAQSIQIMEDDSAAARTALLGYFNTAGPDGLADLELVREFLTLAATTHFMGDLGDKAQVILDNGFTSRHAIAMLTEDDLRGMNFLPGHARLLAPYMAAGGPQNVAANPAAAAADAITAATVVAQQSAAMVAAAVIDGQRPIQLNGGAGGRPSVSATIKFIEAHAQKQATAGYCLAPLLKKIVNDPATDVDPDIISEPSLSSDRNYFRVVMSSLTMDQMEEYGGGEAQSATKLLQNLLCSIAECDTEDFLHALGEFDKFEGTVSLNGIKNRFEQLITKLNEVRFHSLFSLQKAINKLAVVLQPMPHLVHEVFNSWTAPKGQAQLSKIIKSVSTEVKKFKPKTPAAKEKKEDSKPKQDKAKDSWRSPQHQRRGSERNPSSGQSQSNSSAHRQNTVCRNFFNRGSCSYDGCRFEHIQGPSQPARRAITPSVNHITEMVQLRRQIQSQDEHMAEQGSQLAALADVTATLSDQLEQNNTMMFAHYSQGEEYFDCDESEYFDCNEGSDDIAAIMQVQTRSKAPSEADRLRRKANDAKVRSSCNLTNGPIIDSATDTDVIGSADIKHATNVLEHEPFKFQTVCGEGT